MDTNIFEYATRNKLRFASPRGAITVEDLWDVPLRSRDGFDLNALAKAANKAVKDIAEENFVDVAVRTPEHTRREMALAIVKHVIDTKIAEEEAAKKRAENKIERDKILAVLAEKQDGKLSALPEKELLRRAAALE
jgi:hypothetical protein